MASTPSPPNSSPSPRTRTLAIIKSHALKHRLTIEHRLIEAGFEIIKERQMQFNPEADREILEELFGADAESLGEDPVWVYVLERRRAVEVLLALMGDADPEVARQAAPNSLRAIYGQDIQQNAFMGSPDANMAEQQISVIFSSSPPFPSTELPDEGFASPHSAGNGHYKSTLTGSVRSMSSSVLSALRGNGSDVAPASGKPRASTGSFRARPVPATNNAPSIQPRMTRAAALRQGIAPPEKGRRLTTGSANFVDVPGHKRSKPIAVASTATPTIVPRATRASALRSGEASPSPKRPSRPSTAGGGVTSFADVPGHKRSETIQVASTAAPTIAPRPTRASALRAGDVVAAAPRPRPSSVQSAAALFAGVPGHRRTETVEVASVKEPVLAPRVNKSATLRARQEKAPPTSFMFRGPSEVRVPGLSRQSSGTSLNSDQPALTRSQSAASMRTGSVATPASISAPVVAPRTNRSALLRALKGTK